VLSVPCIHKRLIQRIALFNALALQVLFDFRESIKHADAPDENETHALLWRYGGSSTNIQGLNKCHKPNQWAK
jgi:hypothetical protein